MSFPVLNTQRFNLREFTKNDLSNIYLGLSHPEVIKYYGVSYTSKEAAKEQLEWFKNLEKEETGIWWAISSKENSQFLGAVGFNNLSKIHRKAELGFWLLPEFWKKGIISEVLPEVVDFGFKDLNLHRVEAMVETPNINSKNVLKKMKFLHEGQMKDCEIKNGVFISIDIFARINEIQA